MSIKSKHHTTFQYDWLNMNTNNSNKKYKRPKRKTVATTNPQTSKTTNNDENEKHNLQPRCPLLAKDSEWLDNTLQASTVVSLRTTENVSDEEEVLQLVECEDGPEMKPLTIMFPGLLEKDRQTLEEMLNKTMSTTEVTKHLLGRKADFSQMKKVNRLIPKDKKWLETLSEDSNSMTSESQQNYKISSVTNDEFKESIESKIETTKSSTYIAASNVRASTSNSKDTLEK